jgi:hypothetical protein
MTTKEHSAVGPSDRRRLEAVIGDHVLDMLGLSVAGHAVRVRHLWADNYRVNVFAGGASAFAEIAHSYFVLADDTGHVVTATPAIHTQL